MMKEIHFVHTSENQIISNLALQQNPYDDSELWLKHVSVDGRYRNKGLATELYTKAVNYARSQNKSLKRSSPSEMGAKYLSNVVDKIKKENPGLIRINLP